MLLRLDDHEVSVDDADELEFRLNAIAEDWSEPVLASLVGSAAVLTLGLGHPRGGLLMFVPRDGSQPPLHSLGDISAVTGDITFNRGDTAFGFFPRCLVAQDVMVEAARMFVVEESLPANVAWEAEPAGGGVRS